MPRKKSNLSPKSRNAKRLRLIRSQESEEDREARLNGVRASNSRSLESETPAHRESRLEKQRALAAAYRSRESEEKREARLWAQRDRRAQLRESETLKERQSRLIEQRTRAAIIRSQESIEKREARLSADRERRARLSSRKSDPRSKRVMVSIRHRAIQQLFSIRKRKNK